jgi:hypothetical protein
MTVPAMQKPILVKNGFEIGSSHRTLFEVEDAGCDDTDRREECVGVRS